MGEIEVLNSNGDVVYRSIGVDNKNKTVYNRLLKVLEFTEEAVNQYGSLYDGHFVAETPIGRYFIDKTKDGNYESYSDIEDIGSDKTLSEAKSRIMRHHEQIIDKCYGQTNEA